MDVRKDEKLTFDFGFNDADQRLAELILHVSDKCETDDTFGATKLNKILWWADFLSFRDLGKPITGVEYHKLANGPAPKKFPIIKDDLIEKRHIEIKKRKVFNHTQQKVIALRSPNYCFFTGEQIALVDQIVDALWGKTATEVSEMSHGMAWKIVNHKESIPYEAVFLSNEPINEHDILATHELAEKHGWERM